MNPWFLGSLVCVLVLLAGLTLWSLAKAWEWSDDVYGDDYDDRSSKD